jgi:hypothetical protein
MRDCQRGDQRGFASLADFRLRHPIGVVLAALKSWKIS